MVRIEAPPHAGQTILDHLELLHDTDVVFSGWGGPVLDERFMEAAPRLKAVFYGAGSVKPLVTDAFWRRNIPITSAYAANALPVAVYTLSQILFCLKCGWQIVQRSKQDAAFPPLKEWAEEMPGTYGSTVGIVSLDVTDPEPPEPGSPLFTLPNVVLTPHIAGSQAKECRRMGEYMVEELRRFVDGDPLKWRITKEASAIMA